MRNEDFDLLSPKDREMEIKKRSRRRLFIAFLFIDIGLLFYIIYSVTRVFAGL